MTSAWNKEAFFPYLVTLELKSELERKLDTKKVGEMKLQHMPNSA